MILGRTANLVGKAYVKNSSGNAVPTTASFAWRSSNAGVVSVHGATASANAIGSAFLRVSECSEADSISVSVVPQGYAITPIFEIPTDGSSWRAMTNDSDWVAITSSKSVPDFLWKTGATESLGACRAVDINNRGQILCSAGPPTIWENGSITQLDTATVFGGFITDSTHILGRATGFGNSIIWRPNGSVIQLNQFYEHDGINNVDQIIGRFYLASYSAPVIRNVDSTYHTMGTFGRYASPSVVNDSGDAVGSSEYTPTVGQAVAVLWRASNAWKGDLLLQGKPGAQVINDLAEAAGGINNEREIIGSGSQGRFVWKQGRLSLLNEVLADTNWSVVSASHINNRGHILAVATDKRTGKNSFVILAPP